MNNESKTLSLDPDEISVILDAVSLMPTSADIPGIIQSDGLVDPYEGHAESIKEKLSLESAPLSGDEVRFICWALNDYLDLLNKRKAVARKGTARYKRTHSDLKIINNLFYKFSTFEVPEI